MSTDSATNCLLSAVALSICKARDQDAMSPESSPLAPHIDGICHVCTQDSNCASLKEAQRR
eukprot:4221383-Alexandrium_andersonii.AAC.1